MDIVIIIVSHLAGCIVISLVLHHLAQRSSARLRDVKVVSIELEMQYNVVSSAYISIVVSSRLLTISGRSLVYRLNNIGPSTDPCGTPQVTCAGSEVAFPSVVY